MENNADFVVLTAEVVGAYVSNNSVTTAELSALIRNVYAALSTAEDEAAAEPELKPAISIKKLVTTDYIICDLPRVSSPF